MKLKLSENLKKVGYKAEFENEMVLKGKKSFEYILVRRKNQKVATYIEVWEILTFLETHKRYKFKSSDGNLLSIKLLKEKNEDVFYISNYRKNKISKYQLINN